MSRSFSGIVEGNFDQLQPLIYVNDYNYYGTKRPADRNTPCLIRLPKRSHVLGLKYLSMPHDDHELETRDLLRLGFSPTIWSYLFMLDMNRQFFTTKRPNQPIDTIQNRSTWVHSEVHNSDPQVDGTTEYHPT